MSIYLQGLVVLYDQSRTHAAVHEMVRRVDFDQIEGVLGNASRV